MSRRREPQFEQLLRVLAKQRPDRPVLFEFIVDPGHMRPLAQSDWSDGTSIDDTVHNWIAGFAACGFDFATIPIWECDLLEFPGKDRDKAQSVGLAHGGVITDRDSLMAYPWPDPDAFDYGILDRVQSSLRRGQKIVIHGPSGVLENTTMLAGYEELCFLIADDPETAKELFDHVGSRVLRHYERLIDHPSVGAAILNDDWGFKTQPFLPPAQMREFVYPWQRRIVDLVHGSGKPVILHSCGNLDLLYEDIIEDLHIDAKHSYEDEIHPVEEMYERFAGRLGVVGGIDVDFLCRSTPAAVENRCLAMLRRASSRGGYALGSGNSIPSYVPHESFLAMLRAGEGID